MLSGPGLVNIYNYLLSDKHTSVHSDSEDKTIQPSVDNILRGVSRETSPARLIQGVIDHDPTCQHALDLFIECLASHLRLTSLHLLPTGGLYICGGIPCRPAVLARIRELMSPGLFLDDRVMGEFIGDLVSLHVILNDDVGLLGARIRAQRLLSSA